MQNKIVKNTGWIIGCRIIKSLLSVVITMLSARYLGPANYGLINYAASIVAFFTPLMQLGLNATLVQDIVSYPEKEGETLGTALTMNLLSAMGCVIGIAAFSTIANRGDATTVIVCVLYSFLLIFQSLEMVQYWFQAKLLSKYTSIVMLISYGIVSAYKSTLLIRGASVYWFAVSQAIDFAIIAGALLILYGKIGTQKLKFSKQRAKQMFHISKHYILSSLMVTVFAQTDKIMLKEMLGTNAVGLYSAATTCASIASFVFTAIIDSARPAIFAQAKKGKTAAEQGICVLYSIIIYLSLVQCIAITVFSRLVVRVLYGSDYMDAVPTLRIVVWFTLFSYLGSVRNIWILQEGKQRYLWIINVSGALTNVVINFVLIPCWGINGAATASLVTQIFTNTVVGWFIKPIRPNNRLLWRGMDMRNLLQVIKAGNIAGEKHEN